MTANGCSYNDGTCYEVVEQCEGCNRRVEFSSGWFCTVAPEPQMKWRNGDCNLATHVTAAAAEAAKKLNPLKASKKANPLKASKRAAGGGGKKK
jgi:hypothetical protein